MKRAPFYALIVVVAVILGVLGYSAYLYVTEQPVGESGLGIICTAVFIIFAFIAIELMFKPYFLLRGREEPEEVEEAEEEEKETE